MNDTAWEALNKTLTFGDLAFSIRHGEFTPEQLDSLADLCTATATMKSGDMTKEDLDKIYYSKLVKNAR